MKLTALLAAISISLACHATHDTSNPAPAAPQPGERPGNLEQIVRLYQEQSGLNVTYDQQTASLLARIPVKPVGPDSSTLLIGHAGGQAAQEQFTMIPLKNADAAQLADALRGLVQHAAPDGSQVRIVPDERTNALLVSASPDSLAQLEALVAQLDKVRTGAAEGD